MNRIGDLEQREASKDRSLNSFSNDNKRFTLTANVSSTNNRSILPAAAAPFSLTQRTGYFSYNNSVRKAVWYYLYNVRNIGGIVYEYQH